MAKLDNLKAQLGAGWLPAIYQKRVRSQRTRAIHLDIPERESTAEIQYTLLGIELKIGKRRVACPDLATARYLRVFARLGCRRFAIPYNITKVSVAADELETVWQHTLLFVSEDKRARSLVIKAIRQEIDEIGPGEAMPGFNTAASTRSLARSK
jgi:hypothetical protein